MTPKERIDSLKNLMMASVDDEFADRRAEHENKLALMELELKLAKAERGNESLQAVVSSKDEIIAELKETLKFFKELATTKQDKGGDKNKQQEPKKE